MWFYWDLFQPLFYQVRGLIGRKGARAGTRTDCGIPSTELTGVPVTSAHVIRAYKDTGELDLDMLAARGAFTLGTTVLLTCDATGIPQGGKLINYTWHHNCTHSSCEIQDGDPYYRVVNDILLVDVTSWDQGGRYYCIVHYLYYDGADEEAAIDWTSTITVAG